MTLSAEQIAIRKTGVGASEVSKITGASPYGHGAIDVWLAKVGRVVEDADFDSAAAAVGNDLEGPLVEIYGARTGRVVKRCHHTARSIDFAHVLASPDALSWVNDIETDGRGVECKVVGARMAHHWADDTIPDYVLDQVQQNMLVSGLPAWDVVALVGGTDLRIRTVEADAEHQLALATAIEVFWVSYVEPTLAGEETPPPIEDPEAKREYLRLRYPGSEATACENVDGDEAIATCVRWLASGRALEKEIGARCDELENMLIERIGDNYGLEGGWGKVIHYPRSGSAKWKEIAEKLAGGAVPDELIDQHRGEPGRVFRYYPFTPKRPGATKSRSKR